MHAIPGKATSIWSVLKEVPLEGWMGVVLVIALIGLNIGGGIMAIISVLR